MFDFGGVSALFSNYDGEEDFAEMEELVAEQPAARDVKRTDKATRIRDAIITNWRTMSDRKIAEMVGVTATTVGKYRKTLEEEGEILPRLENGHEMEACLHTVSISAIEPAPENDLLYDPVRPDDPAFLALVDDIRQNGIINPIGVSADGFIYDGHRRYAAARHIGMTEITVLIDPALSRLRNPKEFLQRLKSCNTQRIKTTLEVMREGLVDMSDDPVRCVCDYREAVSEIGGVEVFQLVGVKRRSEIVQKWSLAKAIKEVVMEHNRKYGPLSDRKVFYLLLNREELLRNDSRKTPFENSPECYNDVTNMLTRLRIDGSIPFDAIVDETRPVIQWDTHRSVGPFVDKHVKNLFKGYFRDLLQSQPNHIELLVEKNTMASVLRPIASKYTIPMTSGRGYASLPPRKGMVDRFRASGKEKLVIFVISDFDPEGQDIPNALGLSLRDDFGIEPDRLVIVKPVLTYRQTQELDLHEGQLAKEQSSRYEQFVASYGARCWELEAVPTDTLLRIVESAIQDVLDMDAFREEVRKQAEERQELDEKRASVRQQLLQN